MLGVIVVSEFVWRLFENGNDVLLELKAAGVGGSSKMLATL